MLEHFFFYILTLCVFLSMVKLIGDQIPKLALSYISGKMFVETWIRMHIKLKDEFIFSFDMPVV